jgi:thiamine-phosphate pyrophosphorylase
MIARLQYITQPVEGFTYAGLTEEACKAGVRWVQLRMKKMDHEACTQQAIAVKAVCEKYGAKLIINDFVHLAKEIGADGVHLGMNDMDPLEARRILGSQFIIGGTAHNLEEANRQIDNKVDYIGIGPFRFTQTKEDLSPVLGLRGISEIVTKARTAIPFIAIGGIQTEDVSPLLEAGVHGIAISSAINMAESRIEAAHTFVRLTNPTPSSTI